MSVIGYKCNSFEEHKMLSLLGTLKAIKNKFIIRIYYTSLLYKFIIEMLDWPSVIWF